MQRLLLLLFVGSLAIGMMIAAGCSSDDEESNPIISGDPNSPSFELYDNTVAEVPGDVVGLGLDVVFGLMEHQFGSKSGRAGWLTSMDAKAASFDSVSWTFGNGWHVFYFELSEFTSEPIQGGTYEDSLWISGWDSLRFFEDGAVADLPTETTDSLYSRQHVIIESRDSEGEAWYVAGHHRMTLSDEGTDLTYGPIMGVNIIGTDTVEAELNDPDDHSCELAMVTTINLSDIVIPSDMVDDVCPTWGTFSATQMVNLSCGGGTATDSIAFNGTWYLSEVFNNGIAHQTLTFGTIQWTHIDSCGVPLTETK